MTSTKELRLEVPGLVTLTEAECLETTGGFAPLIFVLGMTITAIGLIIGAAQNSGVPARTAPYNGGYGTGFGAVGNM